MKLEIGSGGNPTPGYTHLDANPEAKDVDIVAQADAIPLEDESVEELLAVNILEHVEWYKVKDTLKEWARVVKNGGKIVIHVPDMMWLVKFLSDDNFDWQSYAGQQPFNAGTDKWEYFNHYVMSTDAPYNLHRSVYTYGFLTKLLEKFGFGNFQRRHAEARWLYIEGTKLQ